MKNVFDVLLSPTSLFPALGYTWLRDRKAQARRLFHVFSVPQWISRTVSPETM